jgi:exonuclease VII small subunit
MFAAFKHAQKLPLDFSFLKYDKGILIDKKCKKLVR